MKKHYLYLIPLLILFIFISYKFSLADYVVSKLNLGTTIHNRRLPINDNIANSESQTFTANFIIPTISTATSATPVVNALSIPILLYHEIGDGPSSLYVSVNNFREQMHYLQSNGYKVVNISEAREMLVSKQISPKTVILTFDDGYVSFYTKAWPILQEYGLTATIYVCSNFAGLYNYLTWDQMKIVQSGGVEIGSHSHTHTVLTTINSAALTKEIVGSKQILEKELGVTIKSFAYPTGAYNTNIPVLVKNAGYTSATTVNFRPATSHDDLYLLPRLRVFRNDSMSFFANSLK